MADYYEERSRPCDRNVESLWVAEEADGIDCCFVRAWFVLHSVRSVIHRNTTSSVAVLVEILLWSPLKLCMSTIKKYIHRIKVSNFFKIQFH